MALSGKHQPITGAAQVTLMNDGAFDEFAWDSVIPRTIG